MALEKDAAAHLIRCDLWLRDDGVAKVPAQLFGIKLSDSEVRALAMITLLDQKPNLSNGPESIAGTFNKKDNQTENLAVPFAYKMLEPLCFPTFLIKNPGFWGKDPEVLEHYTMMRLYSVDLG